MSADDRPAPTDALFDMSDRAMAARFGELARTKIRDGRDPVEAARLAASYAGRVLHDEAAARVMPFKKGVPR